MNLADLVSPVPATHGADCMCRACGDIGYRRVTEENEYIRRENRRLADELIALSGRVVLLQEERDIAVRRAARAVAALAELESGEDDAGPDPDAFTAAQNGVSAWGGW